MLKKLKLLKKPLFQKRRWSCDFPPRKMPVALKHRAISRQEKMAFSAPVGLPWDSPPPPTECADGRTYGCTDVRTDGHVTITSQSKFFGLIGYHISLAMELRWRPTTHLDRMTNGAKKPLEMPIIPIFLSEHLIRRSFVHFQGPKFTVLYSELWDSWCEFCYFS